VADYVLTPESVLEEASSLLLHAGFALKYTAPTGSRYFHMSGRRGGMLRLSGHAKERTATVSAMLTLHVAHMPKNLTKLRYMVAQAAGQYLLNTRCDGDGIVGDDA
jgi:hypothetical protein